MTRHDSERHDRRPRRGLGCGALGSPAVGPAVRPVGQHAPGRRRGVRGAGGPAHDRRGHGHAAARGPVSDEWLRPRVRGSAAPGEPDRRAVRPPPGVSGRDGPLRPRLGDRRDDRQRGGARRDPGGQGLLRRADRPHRTGHHQHGLPRRTATAQGGLRLLHVRRHRLHRGAAALRGAPGIELALDAPVSRAPRPRAAGLRHADRSARDRCRRTNTASEAGAAQERQAAAVGGRRGLPQRHLSPACCC